MNETKVIRKLYTSSNFIDEQKFLMEQHKNGWKLKRFSSPVKYTFEKCESEDYVYQIDFNQDKKDEKVYIKMFEDCGWEYIQKNSSWFYFRKKRSDIEEENNIFSDNVSKAEMCKKVSLKQSVLAIVILFIDVFWLIFGIPNIKGSVFEIPAYITGSLIILITVFMTMVAAGDIVRLDKMIKEFSNPIEELEKKQK